MRIILDTGVLFRPAALRQTLDEPRVAILPAVAYAERCRQLRRDGRDRERLRTLLAFSGITVEAFSEDEAHRLPSLTRDDRLWRRHARDALIAAHVREGDELWTTNPRDFEALGLARARIRAW